MCCFYTLEVQFWRGNRAHAIVMSITCKHLLTFKLYNQL